jgi:hypothetical protein
MAYIGKTGINVTQDDIGTTTLDDAIAAVKAEFPKP